MLAGKHILVGITGGIAAYKSAWLVRELKKAGAEVQVVMTRAAMEFVAPLTFSTLSQRKVLIDTFPPAPDQTTDEWTEHIHLGQWADLMMIAPASANTIAKIAHGLGDNLLTTLVLALRCPLAVAPAMDLEMWRQELTQRNIDILREVGCHVIDPEEGELASGLSGPGRLPEVDRLVHFIESILENAHHDLQGKKVLVSAGPTYEPIDPVRFLGNWSSGKMGFALAAAAAQRGAEVVLVSGPVHLRTPLHVRRIDVTTASEMRGAMMQEFDSADCVIMAAAVADFAPRNAASTKMKREAIEGASLSIPLTKNPDILKELGARKNNQVLVGFALETNDGVANATKKLREKNLDIVVLNDPTVKGAGFNADTNIVTLIAADGTREELSLASKFSIAQGILNRINPMFRK